MELGHEILCQRTVARIPGKPPSFNVMQLQYEAEYYIIIILTHMHAGMPCVHT